MPDTLITNLTSGNPAQSGDELVINRGGADRKITAGSIAALASAGPVQLPIITNRYYHPIGFTGQGANVTTDEYEDTLFAVPIVFGSDVTLTRIGISCAMEEAGISAVLGIYPSGANGFPDAQNPIDTVTVDLSTAGDKEGVVSVPCTAGEIYWLAGMIEASAVATVIQGGNTDAVSSMRFYGSDGAIGQTIDIIFAVRSYDGTLPSPFGASTLFAGLNPPVIWVRVV